MPFKKAEQAVEKEIISYLLETSDNVLDEQGKKMVRGWKDPPEALEVLELLDKCVHHAWSSGRTIILLELLLQEAMAREGTTRENLVKQAEWRKRHATG